MIKDGRFAVNPQFEWTGGGLATTALDLARWGEILYEGRAFDASMMGPFLDGVQAKLGPESKYGLGVIIRPSPLGLTYGHSGFMPGYQTELAQYNIELNVPPRPLPGDSALELESDLRDSLNAASKAAHEVGSTIVAIGILPTIMPEHYEGEWISRNNRYTALNDSIFVARGEDIYLDIEGPTGERVATYCDSIAPESACTSVQLHLQVAPSEFAAHWNAAQALSAPQVALAAPMAFIILVALLEPAPRLWLGRQFGSPGRSAALPDRPFVSARHPSGVVISRPANGDQCWDAPRPCTVHDTASLQIQRGRRWTFARRSL